MKVRKTCKYCNTEQDAFFTGRTKTGQRIYRDEIGRVWVGAKCPVCKNGKTAKESRKKDELLGPEMERVKTSRRCRKCGDTLYPNRYFNCEECVKESDPITYFSGDEYGANYSPMRKGGHSGG